MDKSEVFDFIMFGIVTGMIVFVVSNLLAVYN